MRLGNLFLTNAIVLGLSVSTGTVQAQETGANENAPPETSQLDFLIGEWHLETRFVLNGEETVSTATLEARYILDGFAIQVFEHHGSGDFRSTTIYHFDTDSESWAGAAVNTLGNRKILDGKMVDDELIFLMGGELFGGHTGIRRLVYYDITEDSFSFRNDHSPDNGIIWTMNTYSYEATRIR